MTEKFKNCIETAEIMINYAESIIDLATELQYLLVEHEGVKQDRESYTLEKMPNVREHRCSKEWSQIPKKKMDTSISVQKLYLPVYRLQSQDCSPTESIKSK